MFFAMAFSCNDNDRSGNSKRTSGERCSTEAEFKKVLTNWYSSIYSKERDGKFRDTEVDFTTFKIGDATRFRSSDGSVNVDQAYPVTTEHSVRHYLGQGSFPRIYKYTNQGKYMFYVDRHDDCVFTNDGTRDGPKETIDVDQD